MLVSDSYELASLGVIFGSALLSIGTLLLSLGYLVKAIWFLPGRELPTSEPAAAATGGIITCAWCDQAVAAPNVPCARLSPDELAGLLDTNENLQCQVQLRTRGFYD